MKEAVTILMLLTALGMELDLFLTIRRLKRNLKDLLDKEGYQFEEFIQRRRD